MARENSKINSKSSRKRYCRRMKSTTRNSTPQCIPQHTTISKKYVIKTSRHFHSRFSLEIKEEITNFGEFYEEKEEKSIQGTN
jgi:hypothetical protein